MTVKQHKGNIPHVRWIDLKGNNVLVECAIMKEDSLGNLFFIEVPNLDEIDKSRLSKILMNRNSDNFALWDLMSQITLNNGVNALKYFHQTVRIITPTGVIMNPRVGTIGVGTGSVDLKDVGEASPDTPPIQDVVAAAEVKAAQ